jgi:acetyltransferase-like isoleucine patch superfamily enzyme
MYISLIISSLFIAKFLLTIINAIHKPQEGIFYRKDSDKDYRYWSMRNTIKRFPIWVSHKFPFPFMDNICLKVFGVKTPFSNSLFEGWVDTEFIDFGENVVLGQGSIIQSAVIIGEFLIIKKTVIEDNVRIGTHSVIMPGTHIHKNAILAAHSTTIIEQELEEDWIYIGVPARKFKKNRFFEDGLEPFLRHVDDIENLREVYESVYEKRYDEEVNPEEY